MTTEQLAPATAAPNANKALWEKGDFTQIAASMRESGNALIDTLALNPSMEVLDLGCGDGTTAIPAARRGARVLGIDIAANLVAAGNVRAKEAGLSNLFFREGDASHLDGIENDRFDLVISIFGAMFAPKPFDVASEMVRVTRPGGTIVMGNWIPGDPTLVAQILKTSAEFTPPPPEGFVSPMLWGKEEAVRERFAKAGIPEAAVTCKRDSFVFRHDGPPAELVERFTHYYGPTMNAIDAAELNGGADKLREQLVQLFEAQNQSADAGKTEIPATFLRVTAIRPD